MKRSDLPDLIVRRRVWVVLCWTVASALLLPPAAGIERALAVATRSSRSEAAAVDAVLASRFESPFASYAVLLLGGAPAPTTPPGRALLDSVIARIASVPGVTGIRGYEHPSDTLFLSSTAGATFLVVGLDNLHRIQEDIVPPLRAATTALSARFALRYPDLTLRWTGQAVLNADMRRISAESASHAERRALPVTLILLIVAFGTLVAALVPAVSGALAIALALGLAALISTRWPLSILLQNIVTMIGLGLGIDYALLSVTRFREALAQGASARAAASDTARRAGHTIVLSGAAVAIGFLALLAVPHMELRSVAVGGLLAVATAVLIATTLVPAVLSWLGPVVDRGWGLPWRVRRARGEGWRRWGRWVARHPVIVLLGAGLPVAALGSQAVRMNPALPNGGDWLPPRMESGRALRDLQTMGRGGVLQTIHALVELPAGHDVLTPDGWAAVRRLHDWLGRDSRIASVRSFAPFTTARPLPRLAFFLTPQDVRRAFLSADRRSVLLEAVPTETADPVVLVNLVEELRRLGPERLTGLSGARVHVGGLPAARADYLAAVGGRLATVMALVLAGTFVALFVGFRSVLVPLKALALNLLAVGAGFGTVVLVFQDGHAAGLFGLAAAMHNVFPALPTLVFCTVFGLSMDYEVFLVARVAEARREGASDAEALAEGMARTGPVITNAAAIMVVVFGAFTLGDFLIVKMLGLALAVAVLVDATLVRMAVGPALLTLAGRWNWWPGDLATRRPSPPAASE